MKQFQNATYIIIGKCSLLRQFLSPFVLGLISKLQQGGNLIPIITLFRYQNHQYKNQKCSTKQQQIITFFTFHFSHNNSFIACCRKEAAFQQLLFSLLYFRFFCKHASLVYYMFIFRTL